MTAITSRKMGKVNLGHEATASTTTGDLMTLGALINVDGEQFPFKFRYARHGGTELTVFGGQPGREKTRSFRNDDRITVGVNLRLVAVQEDVSNLYEGLTPGQKAALTKKLRAAA